MSGVHKNQTRIATMEMKYTKMKLNKEIKARLMKPIVKKISNLIRIFKT